MSSVHAREILFQRVRSVRALRGTPDARAELHIYERALRGAGH
jgi:hypothetical protein